MRKRLDDDFLYEKLPEAERKLVEELPADQSEHRFSFGFRRKMHLLLGRKLERERRAPISLQRRVLLTSALLLLLSFGILMTSDANQARLSKVVVRTLRKYTEIWIQKGAGDYQALEATEPSYVPKGYVASAQETSDFRHVIYYMNFEGNTLIYSQRLLTGGFRSLNTEDAEVKSEFVDGWKVLLSEKDEKITIYWYDDLHSYLLCGKIEKEELLRMAESIIKNK